MGVLSSKFSAAVLRQKIAGAFYVLNCVGNASIKILQETLTPLQSLRDFARLVKDRSLSGLKSGHILAIFFVFYDGDFPTGELNITEYAALCIKVTLNIVRHSYQYMFYKTVVLEIRSNRNMERFSLNLKIITERCHGGYFLKNFLIFSE